MAEQKLHEIEIERNLLIPLRDGANLSADLYRPAGKGPFPTLMSFYPYHKDDFIGATNADRQITADGRVVFKRDGTNGNSLTGDVRWQRL
jgi:predicted acyl esterase